MAASSQQNSSSKFARVLAIITLILMLSRSCVHVDAESRGSSHADITVEARERISKMTDEYEVVHIDMTQHLSDVEHVSNRGKRDATAQGQHDDQSSSEHVHVHHPPTSSFQIRAFGKTVTLDLKQNTELIPASFKVFTFNSIDESPVITRGAVNCYYHGTVRGLQNVSHAQSTLHKHRKRQQSSTDASEESSATVISTYAAVSTCNGLSGSFGFEQYAGHGDEDPATASSSNSSSNEQGKAYSERYMIEPLVSQTSKPGTYPHAVFKESTYKMSKDDPLKGGCATHWNISATKNTSRGTAGEKQRWDFPVDGLAGLASAARKRVKRSSSIGGGRDPTVYVELAVASDYSYTKANGGLSQDGSKNLFTSTLKLVNQADGLFQELNVRIILVTIFIFTQSPGPLNLDGDSGTNNLRKVHQFSAQYLQPIVHYDMIHFFSAQQLTSPGIAQLPSPGYICPGVRNSYRLVGLEGVGKGAINQYLLSHEIGHNLGFQHVFPPCACNKPGCRTGIMSPGSGSAWSNCTIAWFNQQRSDPSRKCFLNMPAPALSKVVCGNGIVEPGEDCDCGLRQYCKDACCNATTCRYTPGSQCSLGECCSNCTILPAGTFCRPAKDQCDLPDYCDGRQERCSADDFTQSGLYCEAAGQPGTCQQGSCTNIDTQCQKTFFSTAVLSASCFASYNVRGLGGHNCGFNSRKEPIPCKPENAWCGTLVCGIEKPHSRCVTRRLGEGEARTLYVDNGSPCGNGLACWNKECVNTSILQSGAWRCPQANGLGCSGNGVCTHKNVCRCEIGWQGTNCNRQAGTLDAGLSGGSIAGLVIGLILAPLLCAAFIALYLKRKQNVAIAQAIPRPSHDRHLGIASEERTRDQPGATDSHREEPMGKSVTSANPCIPDSGPNIMRQAPGRPSQPPTRPARPSAPAAYMYTNDYVN
ncbi:zinc metalloproteinase-disintegrin-like protein H4 subunit A [Sycon ciliatum]|uniref:zinc metalloproteinase-disintegrin-like protein H4 subunit A n=1 Tax=Sycon ciliatum TaxID=27933 RepID=UPI0031F6ADF9